MSSKHGFQQTAAAAATATGDVNDINFWATSGRTEGLPIHDAVSGRASLEAVEALTRTYPVGSIKHERVADRPPLHLACNRPRVLNPRLMKIGGTLSTLVTAESDNFGRIPFRYASEPLPSVIFSVRRAPSRVRRLTMKELLSSVSLTASVTQPLW